MTEDGQYEISAITPSGGEYTVEQTGQDENFQPEYEARDVTGDTIFRTTYQMYQGKDELSFVDDTGNEICNVMAIDTWDIAGDYLLTDSHNDEELVSSIMTSRCSRTRGESVTPEINRYSPRSARVGVSSLSRGNSSRPAKESLTSLR